MAEIEKTIKLGIDTGDSLSSLGKLKKELANLYVDLDNVEQGSEAFKKLDSQIKNTEKSVKKAEAAFGDAADKIKTLSGSGVERATASFGLLREGLTGLDFGKFKTGLSGLTGSFKSLGSAIAATGIGAIVIGVTLLIQNFDKLAASGGLVGKVFTFIGDTINGIIEDITALSDAIGLTDTKAAAAQEAADARNKKALEERLNLVDKVKSSYEKQIEIAKAAGKDTTDLEKKSADAQKQVLKTNIAYLENIAKQSTFFADLIEPVLQKQKDKLAEIEQDEKVSNATRRKQAYDNAVETKKDREKIEIQHQKDLAELYFTAEDDFNAQVAKGEAERAAEKETKHQKDLQDLYDETEAAFDAQVKQTQDEKLEAEKRIENEKKVKELKISAISDSLSTISSLTELFAGKSKESQRKAFNVQKGVSIAQASMATYESATKAFNSLADIPVVGPVLGGIAAAAAVAAGLANIKKIASQKFEGGGDNSPSPSPSPSAAGGSLSAGSAGGGFVAPPTFNLGGQQIGGAGGLLGSQIGNMTNQPAKVYVTETDISNVSNKVKVIQGNSLFGG